MQNNLLNVNSHNYTTNQQPINDATKMVNLTADMPDFRSSRPEVFCKKDVLRNFVKFTGKHLCLSLFCNKVRVLRPATLLKKRL